MKTPFERYNLNGLGNLCYGLQVDNTSTSFDIYTYLATWPPASNKNGESALLGPGFKPAGSGNNLEVPQRMLLPKSVILNSMTSPTENINTNAADDLDEKGKLTHCSIYCKCKAPYVYINYTKIIVSSLVYLIKLNI